jgi:hypothetical protein
MAVERFHSLLESLVGYLLEFGTQIEPEDLEAFFDAFFEDVYLCAVDDGSVYDVAETICRVFGDVVATGASELSNKCLRAVMAKPEQAFVRRLEFTLAHRQAQITQQQEEEARRLDAMMAMQTEVVAEVKQESSMAIDEDGWQTVQPKRRNNRK